MLRISGRKSFGGSLETYKVIDHIYAMTRHFGPASIVYTIAPDDINNPTSFRLTQRFCNNDKYPSKVNSSFIDAMKKNSSVLAYDDIPVGYIERARAAAQNPVATTLEYQNLIENILATLIKVKINSFDTKNKKVTSSYYMQSSSRKEFVGGLFGHMCGALGVTGAQARSALHLRLILFGGLSPNMLEKVCSFKDIGEIVSNALYTKFCTELPQSVHVCDLIEKNLQEIKIHMYHILLIRGILRDIIFTIFNKYQKMEHFQLQMFIYIHLLVINLQMVIVVVDFANHLDL